MKKRLTRKMFSNRSENFEEPTILSKKDPVYCTMYVIDLTKSTHDIRALCEILAHSKEEIFTNENLENIARHPSYGVDSSPPTLRVGGKIYEKFSLIVKRILDAIYKDKFDKNAVLHDTSKYLAPQVPQELSILIAATNYLLEQDYVKLKE